MRAAGVGANVIPMRVSADPRKMKRLVDTGDWTERKLAALWRKGWDGVIYLNRFEGIPLEEFEEARAKAGNIDVLPDRMFKRLLPSARESIIVFDPAHVQPLLGNLQAELASRPTEMDPGGP